MENQYQRLKREMEKLKTEKSRAEGRLDSLMHDLSEKYGCATVEEAEEKLQQQDKEIEVAQQEYQLALDQFEEEYRSRVLG